MTDRIRQANTEKKQRIASLSDAELQQMLQEPSRYTHTEVEYARAEVAKRNPAAEASSAATAAEPVDERSFSARHPYVIAWILMLAAYALLSLFQVFVPLGLFHIPIQIVAGYFIFKWVVEEAVIPYVSKPGTK